MHAVTQELWVTACKALLLLGGEPLSTNSEGTWVGTRGQCMVLDEMKVKQLKACIEEGKTTPAGNQNIYSRLGWTLKYF